MSEGSHSKLIFLQLNELNFEYIRRYVALGHLPTFADLFSRFGFSETSSEEAHHLANPWIQWPTVHTGLDFSDHGIFRLGDVVKSDHEHIYEVLERHGLTVAAISPFNAACNARNPVFFVPDPWTKTDFCGPLGLRLIYQALVQVADDYARGTIAVDSLWRLTFGALTNMRLRNLLKYVSETFRYLTGNKWYRALICDRLLADAFISQWRRGAPDFATLFLNGGAHLQHHYLFSSKVYEGPNRNPDGYVPPDADPLLGILKVYDEILRDLLALSADTRIILATALHQEPHERVTYYYRIDDHARFLKNIGIEFTDTYRLMTEDFVVCFSDEAAAASAERKLARVRTTGCDDVFYRETGDSAVRTLATGPEIFHIENRGSDLYVQLKPMSRAVPEKAAVQCGSVAVENFDRLISFAQYKNTHHHGTGYYVDTGFEKGTLPDRFPLRKIFSIILEAFGIEQRGNWQVPDERNSIAPTASRHDRDRTEGKLPSRDIPASRISEARM